ncbi:MAG: sensor histidine kinase, partial [Nevskiales bacterium]
MRLPASLFHYSAYEPALTAELLSIGARTSKPHISLVVACILGAVSWSVLSPTVICAWLAFALAVCLFGFWHGARYRDLGSRGATRKQLRNCEWAGIAYAALVSAVWGSSSQLMIPGEDGHNLVVTIVFFGVSAGAGTLSIFSLARLLLAAVVGSTLFVLPSAAMFPQDWYWLAPMVFFYNALIVKTGWDRCQIMVANLKLRDEKTQLLDRQRLETAKAVKANQDKSAFLAAASHDLRQPLHALMLTGHALSLHPAAQGEARVLVQRILEAGNALSQQFNQLMDLSRLESGTYHINIGAVAVPEIIQRVISSHQLVAESKGLRLRQRVDRRLRGAVLSTDGGLLVRVLSHFVDNAIKFSEPGKSILVNTRLRGGRILFAVQDQGIGIAPDQQENIFKPYVQLNNPTRELNRGIGLGLSVVQEATSLIGGKLSLRSRAGQGSRFLLSLPAELSRSLMLPITTRAT